MSKLKELIQQYCPDGVEFVSIGNIITRVRNKGCKNPTIKTVYSVSNTLGLVKAEDFRENVIYSEDTSNYIVIEQGMFAYNPARLNIGSLAWLQTNQSGLVSPMYVVFSIDQTKLLPEFLFLHLKSPYVIGKINSLTESGARFRFDFERWKLIEIPIPPIPIQREIVRLLETFSGLQSTLQTELQKRLQQYNYYRDKLLSFEGRTDVEYKRIGEVCNILDAQRKPISKSKRIKGIYPYYGANGIQDYVSDYIFDGTFLLVGEDGSVINKDNSPVLNWAVGKIWVNNHAHILTAKDSNNLRYIYYALQIQDVSKIVRGVPLKINQESLKSIRIPLPPIDVQERIVSVLDKFETLVKDLSQGLPAEIEARQNQYEYYRNKFLTFDKILSA